MTMTTANDLDDWDQQALQVLQAIRCLIDALRSAPYPPDISVTVGRHNQKQRGESHPAKSSHDSRGARGDHSLIAHISNAGVFDQVQRLDRSKIESSDQVSTPCGFYPPNDSDLQTPLHCDDRRRILYQLVFPLLKHLQDCYVVLDNAPESSPPPRPNDPRTRNKPRPAKGMLSLNDYTNVACLLEFAVCSSLLPRMEHYRFWDSLGRHENPDYMDKPCTTTLAQKRSRSLPKSLSGRISGATLAWGTHVAADDWSRFRTSCSEKHAQNPKESLEEQMIALYENCDELNRLVNSVGRLVLLDRFRPMLLPRHLGDLYLTLIFLERFKWSLDKLLGKCRDLGINSTSYRALTDEDHGGEDILLTLQVALRFSSLNMLSVSRTQSLMQKSCNATESLLRSIDPREAALAYRTLLSGDAAVVLNLQSANKEPREQCHPSSVLGIPPWIRLRLGQCLTKLAEEDLLAVVDVFVASARGFGSLETQNDVDVMTGAAARLARALCAKPACDSGSNDSASIFQDKLCHQFVDFLVEEGQRVYKRVLDGNDISESPSSHYLAMSVTLWATIGQLPAEILKSSLVQRLVSGLFPPNDRNSRSDNLTALQSTSAILMWFATMPSAADPSILNKIRSVMLTSFDRPSQTPNQRNSQITIFGQLLRFAASFRHESSPSKLVTELNSASSSFRAAQRISEMAINKMVSILLNEDNYVCSMALEFVKAVATNHYDTEGYVFNSTSTPHAVTSNALSCLVYERDTCNGLALDVSVLMQLLEQRARVLVEVVVAPIASMTENVLHDEEQGGTHDRIEYSLLGDLFRLVLVIHFWHASLSEVAIVQNSDIESKVDVMLSQYGFVSIHDEFNDGLRLAATVLLGVLCESCSPTSVLVGRACGRKENSSDILEVIGIVIDFASCRLESLTIEKAAEDNQELFSTASIIVSLLVSLLELGAKKRSDHDEEMLQSMLPSLQILSSSVVHNQFQTEEVTDSGTSDLSFHLAELAEMSSHAMALIGARKGRHIVNYAEEQVQVTGRSSRTETITEKLLLAERGLQSSQPPCRAEAVISIRHIARSLLNQNPALDDGIVASSLSLSVQKEKKVMVTKMEQSHASNEELTESEKLELIVRSLARLCLISLADSESYVYLASIQTLVVICDVCPFEILPMTATLIANGSSDFTVLTSEGKASSVTLTLGAEQRIKLAEALIFMIRRRGCGIFLYGRLLLDVMLFGSKQSCQATQGNFNLSNDISCNIQGQTHLYFMGYDRDRSDESKDDDLEARQLRNNTGGPVFRVEEDDLLRATSISVTCELVAALGHATLASYCHILVNLAIDALQLNCSRPVRRAAASLARELYACVERELSIENDAHSRTTMAVAIVCSREDALQNILSSCVSISGFDTSIVNGKTRYLDVATQARCQEALEIRMRLDSLAIFDTAVLIAQCIKWESQPTIKAVRTALL